MRRGRLHAALFQLERNLVVEALDRYAGARPAVAGYLGIDKRSLEKLIAKHKLGWFYSDPRWNLRRNLRVPYTAIIYGIPYKKGQHRGIPSIPTLAFLFEGSLPNWPWERRLAAELAKLSIDFRSQLPYKVAEIIAPDAIFYRQIIPTAQGLTLRACEAKDVPRNVD